MRSALRENLIRYTTFCDPIYQVGDFHDFLANKLQDVAARKIRRLIVSVPPRHGKSRLISVEFPSWIMGCQPRIEVACASYSTDLAIFHSKQAKSRVQSSAYQFIFPDNGLVRGSTKHEEWNTTNGSSYKAVGVGSGITGRGADILIIDDPIKDHKQCMSPTIRNAVWNWYLSTARTRLSPGGCIILVQTRWHTDDLAGRLMSPERNEELKAAGVSDNETWQVVNLPGIAKENDPMGRAPGEALFPERISAQEVRDSMAVLGNYISSALFDGNPVNPGGNHIEVDKFEIIERAAIPKLRWMRYWDLAASDDEKADYTAGLKGSLDGFGNMYLDAGIAEKLKWDKARSRIVEIAVDENVVVGVEAVSGFKTAYTNLREVMPPTIKTVEIGVEGDKFARASPVFALCSNRKIFIVRGKWNQDFINQCAAYPMGEHDDYIDAWSGVYHLLKNNRRILVA